MMNVSDFCNLCTEPKMTEVSIFDLNEDTPMSSSIVFHGTMDEAYNSQYRNCEVCSFDLTDEGLTLNIDTSDD